MRRTTVSTLRAPVRKGNPLGLAACAIGAVALAIATWSVARQSSLRDELLRMRGALANATEETVEQSVPVEVVPQPAVNPDGDIRALVERVSHGVLHCRFRAQGGAVAGYGSAFVIDRGGVALTNYHVASQPGKLEVMLWNRSWAEAEVLGSDPMLDAAMLQIRIPAGEQAAYDFLQPLTLGDSDQSRVGDRVFVFGSPLGQYGSVSSGILSNDDRYLPPNVQTGGKLSGLISTWLQVDAAVNPGNSGGPLLNRAGEVIGLITRKTSGTGVDNLGYALPINRLKPVLEHLRCGGREASYGTLGVDLEPDEAGRGVKVSRVFDNGPSHGHLEVGDLLLEVAGRGVSAREQEDLVMTFSHIADLPPNVPVPLRISRSGVTQTVEVSPVSTREYLQPVRLPAWGMYARACSVQERPARDGAYVASVDALPDGFAQMPPQQQAMVALQHPYDLQVGDIVVQMDGVPVPDLGTFYQAYERAAGAGPMAYPGRITVLRRSTRLDIARRFQVVAGGGGNGQ